MKIIWGLAKMGLYVIFSPFLALGWIICGGSALGTGIMKAAGTKPYRGGRR